MRTDHRIIKWEREDGGPRAWFLAPGSGSLVRPGSYVLRPAQSDAKGGPRPDASARPVPTCEHRDSGSLKSDADGGDPRGAGGPHAHAETNTQERRFSAVSSPEGRDESTRLGEGRSCWRSSVRSGSCVPRPSWVPRPFSVLGPSWVRPWSRVRRRQRRAPRPDASARPVPTCEHRDSDSLKSDADGGDPRGAGGPHARAETKPQERRFSAVSSPEGQDESTRRGEVRPSLVVLGPGSSSVPRPSCVLKSWAPKLLAAGLRR